MHIRPFFAAMARKHGSDASNMMCYSCPQALTTRDSVPVAQSQNNRLEKSVFRDAAKPGRGG
jgi:hypothetical protein